MFTFKTSDQKEVRRFRMAQFNGRTATAWSAGSAVTGHVRSIVENKSSSPAAWTITIIPEQPKPTVLSRSAPRVRSFVDLCGAAE
jgi:glycogen debranching enzyme